MKKHDLRIRSAAVAGSFYSADPQQLSSDILGFIEHANCHSINAYNNPPDVPPKAIVSPHAGYIYSGPVAACAYKLLQPYAKKITQIIVLGPAHRLAFKGIATPAADFFTTPLGQIRVNNKNCKKAQQLNFINENNLAHKDEHSIEVQLPFLQTVLSDFEITPLLVGDCNHNDVTTLLQLFINEPDTLIIISTDLSHFHDYATAIKQDTLTSEAILSLQPDNIHYADACGRTPLSGLLTLAKQEHLHIDLLNLKNSGDTAGDKNRVVGYASYVIY